MNNLILSKDIENLIPNADLNNIELSSNHNDMWKLRALNLASDLGKVLIYLRDNHALELSSKTFMEHTKLNNLEELVFEHNGRYSTEFDKVVSPLKNYLLSLPMYSEKNIKKQSQMTLEQHKFIVMQLESPLKS